MDLLRQFKFPSPFTRAYLNSPQLVQEALEALNIGPFQSDGELLCMCFLKPSEDPPNAEGVGNRSWDAFRRVSDRTQSVVPSDHWRQWYLGLDERVPFSPSHASDLERSLWSIMEKVTCGKPSYTFTPREYGWELHDREVWHNLHRLPSSNWQNGGTRDLPN